MLNYLEGLIADERAWTAVAAYKPLGRIDISLVLDRLKRVANIVLQRAFEKSQAIDIKLNHFEKQLANPASVKEVFDKITESITCFIFLMTSLMTKDRFLTP